MTPSSLRPRCLLFLPWLLATGCGTDARPRPACDVVLISLDTVRADDLTFLDPNISPNFCALAKRGVVFDQAIAGSSWTLPAHAELFTGLPPILHGVHDDGRRIDPEHPTLGELLDERGAHTEGVFSGWYLAGAYGFERGFDRYECALAGDPNADRDFVAALEAGGSAALWAGDVRGFSSHRDVSSAHVVQLAQAAVARTLEDEALALFVHFFDPHHDFIPPPPFDTRLDPDYKGTLDGRDYWSNRRIFDPERSPGRVVGDEDLEHLRALYRGEIAWCDDRLGDLLNTLESSGRMENTLIVVVADHGEEFFEHGNRGHRQTLYDEVLRVPLLVVPPSAEGDRAHRGTRVARQVSLCDVLPTILDYVGGPPPENLWGRSLRPLLEGEDLPPRPVVSSLGLGPAPGSLAPLRMLESFRTEEHKLVRRLRLGVGPLPAEVESVEWFELQGDPNEQRVRTAADDARVQDAWAAAEAELDRLRQFSAGLPRSPISELTTDVTRVFQHELAALGYAGEDLEAPGPEVRWPLGPGPRIGLPSPIPD